jgi:UDP-N-acetylmuramoyl-tripeptide--D-alanyl-D-alanine ligase
MSLVSYNDFLVRSNGKLYTPTTNPAEILKLLIPEISTDSRHLTAGQTFIALVGESFNGHDFLPQAILHGAQLLIVATSYEHHLKSLNLNACHVIVVDDTVHALGLIASLHCKNFTPKVAAITGSCGKTTVKQMLKSILEQSHKVLVTEGSYNNEIGVPKTLLKLNYEHEFVVLEMGARNRHDIEYLCSIIKPDVSLVNNVAAVHLETFKTLDDIASAKGKIYMNLSDEGGTAIINVDDQYAPYWLSNLDYQNILTFGAERTADITCAYTIAKPFAVIIELVTDVGSIAINLPVVGKHNVLNALAASAMARAFEISLHDIKAGLEQFTPAAQRMQYFKGINGSVVIDDCYNAAPAATLAAMEVLASHKGKKIMVFGDMLELGDESINYHQLIGENARKHKIDYLFTYGNESLITQQAFAGDGEHFKSKLDLAHRLLQHLDSQTVTLIKGSRGMQMEDVTKLVTLVD